jgi:hypothetical protein
MTKLIVAFRNFANAPKNLVLLVNVEKSNCRSNVFEDLCLDEQQVESPEQPLAN